MFIKGYGRSYQVNFDCDLQARISLEDWYLMIITMSELSD